MAARGMAEVKEAETALGRAPLLVSSSGHVVGRQPRPRAESGRVIIVLAVVAIVGVIVLTLGSLSTTKSGGDHIVVALEQPSALATRATTAVAPTGASRAGAEAATPTRR